LSFLESLGRLLSLASIFGFIYASYVVIVFLTAPSMIQVSDKEVIIKGVPFEWVVYSLFAMQLRNIYDMIVATYTRIVRRS
jgi:hypothetical protein